MRRVRPEREDAPPSSAARARSAALALLNRRDYTRTELARRLADRGFDRDHVDDALDGLARAGLVDDRRVAAAHVRTASGVKGRGRLRIRRELEARGVASDVIADILRDLPPEDDAAAIERFLARQRLPARLSPADRDRLVRRLMRRGFSADAVLRALRRRTDDD